MSFDRLSAGAVKCIFDGETVEKPVLQVIEMSGTTTGDKERYRLLLSDGINFITSMVTSSLNPLCKEGHIGGNTVIRIKEHILHTQGPRKIVIILDVEVLNNAANKIGNPVAVDSPAGQQSFPQQRPNTNTPAARPPQQQQTQPQNQSMHSNVLEKKVPQIPSGRGPPQQPPQQNSFTEKKTPAFQANSSLQKPPSQQNLHSPKPPIQNQNRVAAVPKPMQQQQQYQQQQNQPQHHQQHQQHQQSSQGFGSGRAQGPDGQVLFPISSLNPWLPPKWTIKCRVAYKSGITNFTNQRMGDGKLFSVELVDSSGEINCTSFNESVDTFFPLFEVGHVYFISRARIKDRTGAKFTSIENKYEMNLSQTSVVAICNEDCPDIPQGHYSFRSLAEVSQLPDGDVIDVIAILSKVSDMSQVASKKDPNNMLIKRTVSLTDDTGYSIDMTLWGESAQEFSLTDGNPVLAIKNLKVTDFSGRSLATIRQTRWEVEPDIPRTHQLHAWAAKNNIDNVQVLSRSAFSAGGPSPFKSLREARMEAAGGKPVFFTTQATVLLINHSDNAPLYYTSCPSPGCSKKVSYEESTNMWFCSKCGKSYPNNNARYILYIKISDDTLSEFATVFNDAGNQLLGKDANEVRELRERQDQELDYIFELATQRRFNFKIKAQEESYQDELRVKFTIQNVESIKYDEECKNMLEKIHQLMGMKD